MDQWLSPPRLGVYLAAAAGDRALALQLYEWNAQLSAAVMHDIAHVEVALRNAYDRALSTWWAGPGHWTSAGDELFAPLFRRRGSGSVDVNRRFREQLQHALTKVGGPTAPPGKVVAELMFGFWRYLSSNAHDQTLWVPTLHRAFPAGTARSSVDAPVGRIYDVRNRVAHHEPLLRINVAGRLTDCLQVSRLIDADLGRHVEAASTITKLIGARPG